jgi:hypothetical protein
VEEDLNSRELRIMAWDPEGDAEKAEADRFFEAANWQSWTSMADLQRLLRRKGPWLIRWNMLGRYEFLTTKDEHLVFEPPNNDFFLFHSDPDMGVQVTSEEALHLIPRLTKEIGGWIFEPVKLEQAMNDLRPTRLPQAGLSIPAPAKRANPDATGTRTEDLIQGLLTGPAKEIVRELYECARRLQEDLLDSPPPGFIPPGMRFNPRTGKRS